MVGVDERMTVKELCAKHNISQTALARRYGIPLRTVQNWCGDQCPARISH